ncbi:MAG: hypothetical protein ORN23_02090, partial [Chthoniobacterales bacterium]|nr:hypothetical protein [Chthoniobacterales bacterium]
TGLQSTQQPSTTSTNQYHPNFSFDVSQLWGQVKVPLQASLREHISSATAPQYLQHCVHAKPSTLDCRRSTSLLSSFSGNLCKSLAVSFADHVPTSIVLRTALQATPCPAGHSALW